MQRESKLREEMEKKVKKLEDDMSAYRVTETQLKQHIEHLIADAVSVSRQSTYQLVYCVTCLLI